MRTLLLRAFLPQENVELMTKRVIPLENRDEETNLSDVQQVRLSRWLADAVAGVTAFVLLLLLLLLLLLSKAR